MKGKKVNEKVLIYAPYIIFDITSPIVNLYSTCISISSRYKIEKSINEIRKEKINNIKKTIN